MRFPKLYSVVEIEFPSLCVFYSLEGASENDVMVRRRARRVLSDDGWKWQMTKRQFDNFYAIEEDVICLNNCDLDDVLVCANKTKRVKK